MRRFIKIELTEKELSDILAKHFNLNPKKTDLTIHKYDSGNDPREQDYVTITVTGDSV